jgi:rubrerythrin
MDKMKLQLLSAWVGENIAGGYYHRLSELYRDQPKLASRFRKTAGDEIRHGEYFSRCHEQEYGAPFGYRKLLIETGRVAATLSKLVPERILPLSARLHVIARGEAAAVAVLEKELAHNAANPYLAIVEKILPDERTHAEPYLSEKVRR